MGAASTPGTAEPGTELLIDALARATERGAHAGDALLASSRSVETRVRGDEIDFVKQSGERTLGLRLFVRSEGGLSSAITSTSDLSEGAVDRLVTDTVALARATAPDPAAGLPDGGFAADAPELDLIDPDDLGVGVEERIAWGREAERAARSADPRITNSEGSDASSHFGQTAYANTAGFTGSYQSASHALYASPVAGEHGSMQTDVWATTGRRLGDLEPPAEVGRRAAERAVAMLGAKRVPTCEVPVVFDATTARSLLANLAACLSGYAVYRGGSFLKDRMGEAIASSAVTIVDDGRLQGGLGSRPFDGEGLPTRRTVVVEKGRLRSWLLDGYSARKLGLASTGNASRGAGSAPSVGPTNLWIEPGTASEAEIVADTGRGLLVTGLFGHGFNPVTGDFSRGARGRWIENGEPTHAVEEITVAGNLLDILQHIDAIGSELLWLGRISAPPLRVARMTVAGA